MWCKTSIGACWTRSAACESNWLGVAADGTTPLGNAFYGGMLMLNSPSGTQIGGTAPGQGNVVFSHIEQGMSFPLPTPSSQLDDYIVYVGFDPLAAEPKEPAKPKPKGKPAPPKANPSQ